MNNITKQNSKVYRNSIRIKSRTCIYSIYFSHFIKAKQYQRKRHEFNRFLLFIAKLKLAEINKILIQNT